MSQWSKNEKIVQLFQIGTSNRFLVKHHCFKSHRRNFLETLKYLKFIRTNTYLSK